MTQAISITVPRVRAPAGNRRSRRVELVVAVEDKCIFGCGRNFNLKSLRPGVESLAVGKNPTIQESYEEAMPWLNESRRRTGFRSRWCGASLPLLLRHGTGRDSNGVVRKAERGNYEAGAVHKYQVVLANIGKVYLYRRDHFMTIS
jgi:hypothetical protein